MNIEVGMEWLLQLARVYVRMAGRHLAVIACVIAFCSSPLVGADEEQHQDIIYNNQVIDSPCISVLRGSFTASDTPGEVYMGWCDPDLYLQFEDGPRWEIEADSVGDGHTCMDDETGLDQIMLKAGCMGSGCMPGYHVYSVNAETKRIEHLFSMAFYDQEGLESPLATESGACLWRGFRRAKAALDTALKPLLIGRKQDVDPWDLKPGETLAFSSRLLPAETVMNALGAIRMYGESSIPSLSVDVLETKHISKAGGEDIGWVYPDNEDYPQPEDRAPFRALQITQHPYYRSGILLVEDRLHRTWTAIRDFSSGERMDALYIEDDKLYMRGGEAYDFTWFELDLRNQIAKGRIPFLPEWIGPQDDDALSIDK